MTVLNTVALVHAKPGSESVVKDALMVLLDPTRAEEGCLRYDVFESAAAPGTFILIEEYADQEALDAHLTSAHVAAALETVGNDLTAPPDIHPLKPA